MAQKAETKFKEKVLKDLRALPKAWAVKIQQVAIRGTPDVLACLNGRFVALELKKDEKSKLDPLQEFTLECIGQSNGWAFKVYPENWDETLLWIKSNLY